MSATAEAVAGEPATSAPDHTPKYRFRRFVNWFPLGLTYATFYMGRYNFNVVKGHLGTTYHLDKAQTGFIATAGFWTYALSVIFNGPLADRVRGQDTGAGQNAKAKDAAHRRGHSCFGSLAEAHCRNGRDTLQYQQRPERMRGGRHAKYR